MLAALQAAVADQTAVRLLLSGGGALEGVVARCDVEIVELRHSDGSRSLVCTAAIIALTVR